MDRRVILELVFAAGAVLAMTCPGAGLPEAWAPFERSSPARQPVELRTFPYRTGPVWRPSPTAYPWAEFVAGDKSVMIAGTDARAQGMGAPADGVTANGFGHIAFYAGKNEVRKPGVDFLGEVRFLLKAGGPWNEAWKADAVRADETTGVVTWTRPWRIRDASGVFTYTAKADGDGRVRVDWDAGVAEDVWESQCLARSILVFLTTPKNRPAAAKMGEDAWELNPSDPSCRVSVRIVQTGPKGTLLIDLHESTALTHPSLPKVGGYDFWGTDAYDVPVRPGRNLILNGSFEQGFKGWRFARGTALASVTNAPGVRFTNLDGAAKFGRRALHVHKIAEGDLPGVHAAPLQLDPGEPYTVSLWSRGEGGVAVGVRPLGNQVKQKWPEGKQENAFSGTKEWRRHAVTFIASEEGTDLIFWFWGREMWLDGVMVEKGTQATETTFDPVEAEFVTAGTNNYVDAGAPINARLVLCGRPGLAGEVRVSIENCYHETVHAEAHAFTLDEKGGGLVTLPGMDGARLGTGLFVVRLDYGANGQTWHDFARFTIIERLKGEHPLAGFFAHFPWFADGSAYMCTVSPDFAEDVADLMRAWGVGATSWQPNARYARGLWAPWFRKYGIVNKLHLLQTDLSERYPERFGWGRPGLATFTNATPEELSFIEAEAYRSAKEAAPDDLYWTFSNEEELWQPLVKKHRDFDRYFKYQHACWKGLKRGFDERGMTFLFAPTHGTAAYFHESSRSVLDGYLEAARKQGFKFGCVSVHLYHAVDGSVLGAGDREENEDYLVKRLKDFGYDDSTPILFPEGYNILPMHIPAWEASDWADCYQGTIPALSFSNRECLQAGAMMRAYLIGLKYYPRCKVVHTWQTRPVFDIALTPYLFPTTMNTLGRLLPDPRFVGAAHPYPDVRGYCFRPTPGADDFILAVWTTNNDVENGVRKGDVLEMTLPKDARFYDFNANERAAVSANGTTCVPMTPMPLFIRSKDGEGLLAALRNAKGGTAKASARRMVAEVGVVRQGKTPNWDEIASVPLTNGVRRASARFAWNGDALLVRVETTDWTPTELDVAIDGLADARDTPLRGLGPDDCVYRFTSQGTHRVKATNTQFRDGGASGRAVTETEVAEKVKGSWKSSGEGGVWEIALASRYIAPVRMERDVRFGFNLTLRADRASVSLAPRSDPIDFPLFVLK